MTTETNLGRCHNKSTTLSRGRPGTRLGSPEHSSKTSSGGRITHKPNHASISSQTDRTRRNNKEDTHLQDGRALGSRRVRGRQGTGLKKTTRQSYALNQSKEKGKLESREPSSGSLDLHAPTLLSHAPDVPRDDNRSGETRQSKSPLRSIGETDIDEAVLRHRALRKLEEQEKKKASDKYEETGDMSVFAPFMAPFVGGPDRPNLGSWIWDDSVLRWRREHTLGGRVVWAPTDDCFI